MKQPVSILKSTGVEPVGPEQGSSRHLPLFMSIGGIVAIGSHDATNHTLSPKVSWLQLPSQNIFKITKCDRIDLGHFISQNYMPLRGMIQCALYSRHYSGVIESGFSLTHPKEPRRIRFPPDGSRHVL